ncbi:MAG: 16S rRNA (guanine(527)-N(7))-methyltransferase RsmG [Eggerthellaceae bacterium]|jgi:16S rRNA (guanine527-N7)-methyltransferase|nr:16S rRNA (guanine(527)-N(7))-methyltransferase RsmG [Eggerthellaceae bacterium]
MHDPSFPINSCHLESFSPEKRELLEKHLALVLEANKKINLTSITSFEEGLLLHIEDALAGFSELSNAPKGLYVDIGTGAGYPGIPLAIVSERDTLLVDSVQKKTKVLDKMLVELGISSNVRTYGGRIEALAQARREEFAVVSARALSSLAALLELSSPLLQQSGRLICYKAQQSEEELAVAKALEEKLGMRLVSNRSFFLSDNVTKRQILVYEKYKQPEVALPRREGMAQKRPYRA